ncbi:LacI family DNA-binding transcriptional regulator [Lysobacter cavernae]|uniref:LacI family DNA-binding transcriptional regulator n=1 Tax=Lysobacter cavernae TaxID=1685901 RepID=A0ABV7RLN2_9GAMM
MTHRLKPAVVVAPASADGVRAARMEDVAAAAGVSMKTVSRVFNREPNVREATRSRVEQIARQLNYQPNTSARSLAANRSYLVALLYDNPSSNYVMEVIDGVLDACRNAHYNLMLRPIDYTGAGHVEAVAELVAQYRPDGLVLTPPLTDDRALLERLQRLGVRHASLSARPGNAQLGASLNERRAAAEMLEHVVALGHRRIGHITGHRDHGARAWRLAGYRDGLRRAGIEFDPALVIEGEHTFHSGVEGARRLLGLADPPTALFAANDDMAAGVIYEACERGLRIPDDLSVLGFDDTPLSQQIWPGLTTVRQPSRDMGRIAAEQLLLEIRGTGTGQVVQVPYQLQLRRSLGPARQP